MARLRLAVERLRNRSRAAHVAEKQDFDLKVASLVSTRNMSPIRTSRAALAGCWLDRILPSSQARAASARVLKNLAAQSHLSILTLAMIYFPIRAGSGLGALFPSHPLVHMPGFARGGSSRRNNGAPPVPIASNAPNNTIASMLSRPCRDQYAAASRFSQSANSSSVRAAPIP